MERAFKIGCPVIFFDSQRQPHAAFVTNWFHGGPDGQTVEEYHAKQKDSEGKPFSQYFNPNSIPCCNLVYASSDATKTDPYGRQLERATSCSYGRNQGLVPFVGYCWCWPDEFEEAKELAAKAYAEAVAK